MFGGTARSRTFFRFAVLVPVLLAIATPSSAVDHVVLVSWDGVRRDILHELLEWQDAGETPIACPSKRHPPKMPVACNGSLTCLPTICRFQIIDSEVVEGKPLTRPQHAQMLSGYGPQETGEITNAGKRALPEGLSIYERIDAARDDVLTVHIAGRKFVGRGIIKWARRNGALDIDSRRGGRDHYTGANTTRKFQEQLDQVYQSPFFIFVHFKAADVIAHRASDKSDAHREAIIQNDVQLGAVLDLLADRGVLDDAEVLVTTDHGFDGIFHVNFDSLSVRETWFASYNPVLTSGPASVLDVTPTVLTAFGIPLATIEPPYRGSSLLAGPGP